MGLAYEGRSIRKEKLWQDVYKRQSYEYLWHNIREVGGAYGTGMVTQNDGTEYLLSLIHI